ncbi:efflux RND transporter permease subunit [Pseudomarimonas salicorniae]|uniref:Efflux RND transporter permease subunit n=1 Tax=Pseudomarimonas salicorniae TaxID=2933270 RepID=A0ABT0GEW2_9GAMM|nr:efflux RND transporter permease subunit [Lysobacter sp. CAU 1642]MCK7592560.1 efflux RND transporter permease subunit [Lysobacter sp. CAU 1642]
MNLLAAMIRNHPLANIGFAVVILLGMLAFATMPREQDPEINFNWVNISTALPGASAADVEDRVTNPLEDSLRNVQDVRFIASSSREGVSNILVRFRDMPERVFDKRVNDLRREVQNTASAELPEQAIDPVVLEITTSNGFPTAMVLLTGQAGDETLRYAAREIQNDLERIAGVDRVLALGFHEPELQVDFDPEALAAHGLNPDLLADQLRGWFRDVFAGKLKTEGHEWLVRVDGTTPEAGELARFSVRLPDGRSVPLESLARVGRGHERPRELAATDGRAAVLFSVTKVSRTNTLELVERIDDYLERRNPVLAVQGLELRLADDQTIPTREALGVMQSNAAIGLLLVMAVCWVFLGSRIAAMVALGVVFSICGALLVLQATGNTLNVSVLLGIVIVLGMLVDDAVVVVEAIYFRLQRGMPALQASLESLREVGLPVLAAVATTMAAFLPLMLLPGIVGKFMFVIPFVVSVGLAVSLIEAMWMLPAHVSALGPRALRTSRSQAWRARFTHRVRVLYTRALIHVMRQPRRYLGIALALFLGALAAVAAGAVRMQFFAFDPLRIFYVNVDMPASSSIEQTLARTGEVEQIVRAHLEPEEARSVVSLAGIKFTEMEPVYGDHYGQITVSLAPAGDEDRSVDEVIESMRRAIEDAPGISRNSFLRISGGPPASKAISVKVRGNDFDELRAATAALKREVAKIPGSRDVVDNDTAGRPEYGLEVDLEAVRRAGLDPGAVARLVRLHVDGEVVAELRHRGEKTELRVRARPEATQRIDDVLQRPVALPGGGSTQLGALVRSEVRDSPGLVRHWNWRRAITLEADLAEDGVDTVTANRMLREAWEGMRADYPGVDLDFSGELDDINESLAAMGPLFGLGLGLIYLILAAQFRSYFQPLLILVTVPLAFTGVTIGLLISRNPMSLYTLYGVIALTGIAVNAAIVLIDAANQRRAAGMRTLHATIYAARRRVVAVLMTTGTTIAGLFSLAFGLGGSSLLWGPVAASIVWGLAFSSVLTLFVVPVLYRQFMKQRR